MKIYTCQQMKAIEENANKSGMSYVTMMENAGKACYNEIIKLINCTDVTIICGNGKNAGDGFVIARYLGNSGYKVNVILACGEPKAYEAVEMYNKMDNVNISITNSDDSMNEAVKVIKNSSVIIDCIFGIGFKGTLKGSVSELTKVINNSGNTVISVDIPSGLEGDAQSFTKDFIKADYTLAVTCKKPVHVIKPFAEYCGEVRVVDIGFSEKCYEVDYAFNSADDKFIKASLVPRKTDSNKGTYGKLLCVCGSKNMQGAAVLCANAAVRSGAGLVFCAFPEKAYSAIASKLTEPLMLPLADDEKGFFSETAVAEITEKLQAASAVIIGCGIGVTQGVKEVLLSVINNSKCPIIIDADGLNILSENIDILKTASVPVVLTPHPGEMSRLLGKTIDEIQADRIGACKELTAKTGAVVLLKGSNTVIAYGDEVYINPTGNPGMAKGGCGDVLSGIISSLVSQGVNPFKSAVCGAYIHGLCGDIVAEKSSLTGMTPSMMIDYLPELFSNFENKVD